MSNPAHQNLPLDSVHYSLLYQPTPLTFSPLKSSSSVFILNSSFAFLCRSSLSLQHPCLPYLLCSGASVHIMSIPVWWPHSSSLARIASQTMLMDIPPSLHELHPEQSALIADASNRGVTVRLKYGTTLLPPFWFKGCFFFLVHVLKAHGLFNSEYNHYIGVLTSLKWFYLPRKSLDLVITHPKRQSRASQSWDLWGWSRSPAQ